MAAAGLAAAVSPLGAQDGTNCRFSDVPQSSPQQADILYACQQGWFEGYPDGTFRPDREVPQHQIAAVVSRAFPAGSSRADLASFLWGGNPGDPDVSADFDDVAESHPQNRDIAYAVGQGWFQGYPDGTFRPDRTITSNQIATVVGRAFPAGSTRADLATFMRQGTQALNDLTPPTTSSPKIAYTVPKYDSFGDRVAWELWVADSDGSGQRRLTDDFNSDWQWSPGGERIAYSVAVRDFRGNKVGGVSELWVSDADGSSTRKLIENVDSVWGWSPDGKWIVYEVAVYDFLGEVSWDVWEVSVDGSESRSSRRFSFDYWGRLSVSTEADLIFYTEGGSLWVASADGSEDRKLIDDIGHRSWLSPGSDLIAYTGVGGLRVVRTDGSGVLQLDLPNYREDLWWSSDGNLIAYEGWDSVDEAWELWVVVVDSLVVRRLIQVDGSGRSPFSNFMWSPNEDAIVLEISMLEGPVSSRSVMSKELWIAGVDGSWARQLTDDFAYEWRWSFSGEYIAYESNVWEFGKWLGTGLWVVDADGTKARQVSNDIEDWIWSPGENRIIYEEKVRDSGRR